MREVSLTPREPRNDLGGAEWGGLIDSLTDVIDLAAGTNPPPDVVRDATRRLEEVAALLSDHGASPDDSPAGQRSDIFRRGHPLLFETTIDDLSSERARGRVKFSRMHLGKGAVHGGVLSKFFDEIAGTFVASKLNQVMRTAYLHVNYRKLVAIETELRFEVLQDRQEGRKYFLIGRLLDGDALLTDAELLMIAKEH